MRVDTVIAESGVAKATLYKHFPRKDDLVLAYLSLLVDGGLASGVLDADADVPAAAREAARTLVDAACRRDG
ncbi:TetR family transcriptional regulator [Cellulomonas carbonis]|uniref:HTH tetR-type domain-containing protein n=1 Tax=Cellulomonas carbonis T26 TaxID=947969 RepID=A0A0A0BXX7_9CELL|nr:hypothetical protein N868_00050 [Cellulomonas carbonis T26]GGC13752.1 hypothetical protein GCM10010972_28870 [Cellulomonas carbonis]